MSDVREPETSTVIQERPAASSTVEISEARLTVLEGPDAGRSFELAGADGERTLVGASPVCGVKLSDREVSRRHAAFEAKAGLLHVRDLGSTNGTFVNGVRVVEAILAGGEVLRVGATSIRVETHRTAAEIALPDATSFGRVVGASLVMRRLYERCAKLAASNVPLLIEGETGTGKEALAEALHEASPRAAGPFVVFDCTSVAPTLLEAELFGHERGAFTGAVSDRRGVFEEAHGGTLLIDEIGDLDIALQAKLLRCIERGQVRRIGASQWTKVDVRVLAATRRDLDREIQDGRFRDDLFFRVAVARIELPPLRAREGDVPLLVRHFAKGLGEDPDAIPYEVLDRFERSEWPGNVRELANAVARYYALGEGPAAPASSSAPAPGASGAPGDPIDAVVALGLPLPAARQKVVAEFERRYIAAVLAAHGGNIARAAEASGIARRYFNLLLVRQRSAR